MWLARRSAFLSYFSLLLFFLTLVIVGNRPARPAPPSEHPIIVVNPYCTNGVILCGNSVAGIPSHTIGAIVQFLPDGYGSGSPGSEITAVD